MTPRSRAKHGVDSSHPRTESILLIFMAISFAGCGLAITVLLSAARILARRDHRIRYADGAKACGQYFSSGRNMSVQHRSINLKPKSLSSYCTTPMTAVGNCEKGTDEPMIDDVDEDHRMAVVVWHPRRSDALTTQHKSERILKNL